MTVDVFQMRMAMGKKQGLSGGGSGSLVAAASSSYTAQRLQQERVQQGALCPMPPPLTAPTRPAPIVLPMLQSYSIEITFVCNKSDLLRYLKGYG